MIVRPAICIVENEKILTMRYRYGNTDVFNLPGGNLEFGTALGIHWLPIKELPAVHLYPAIGKELLKAIKNELPDPFLGRVVQPWA